MANTAKTPYIGGTPYSYNPGENGNIPIYGIPLPNHAGVSQRPDTGYDVVASKINQKRRENALARTNGQLNDGTWYVNFFALSINLNVELSGSTGQSRFTRDFYPHNQVMPSFTVVGQCLDQNDYGTLVEFVHQAQQKGVYDGTLLQLEIAGNGLPIKRPIMRGPHKSIIAQGFIKTMPRKHEKFIYAPIFTFSFVISTMFEGIYKESTAPNPEAESWAQILSNIVAESDPISESNSASELSGPPLAGKLGAPGATSPPAGNQGAQNSVFGTIQSENGMVEGL